MDVNKPLPLLAGLSPAQFMRRHWQKKPLLVRQAIPGFKPVMGRAALFALAARQDVESRLIVQQGSGWRMKHGPLAPRSLPPVSKAGWTLLVQSVDGHDMAAHALLQQFRFVPDVRLDDLMISYASPGGGVGPHFDSYDVFLLQASGRRRWRIGRQKDLTLQPGVPLKILQHFEPDEEFVLEAGDMLYLPPAYAHDGVAEGAIGADGKNADCMTYSVGFKAPSAGELAAQLLHRLAEFSEDSLEDSRESGEGDTDAASIAGRRPAARLYRDRQQPATTTPAALPSSLLDFAQRAVMDALKDPRALACALGESMTEPKASVYFESPARAFTGTSSAVAKALRLDARTRMMYDNDHVFMNGESYRARGADATLMRRLADRRALAVQDLRKASAGALALFDDWHAAGWLHEDEADC
jgi:50S ribosomal protein L16 3-hydroxylase